MSDSIKKVVFISGMISDDKDYQEKFAEAENTLTEQGYIVLNPAKAIPNEMSWESSMDICMAMIKKSDVVCFLPDWWDSKGAKLEHDIAEILKKEIKYYNLGEENNDM